MYKSAFGGLAPRNTLSLFSGVNINIDSQRNAIGTILDHVRHSRGFMLFTLNLDHVAKLRRDRAFRDSYRQAELVSADGWPIVWHYRRNGVRLERTTGADLVEPLCAVAAAEQIPVYFIGPMPEHQAAAIAELRRKYPGLCVAGAEAPQIDLNDRPLIDGIAERLRASGARLCILSLGAPKQELFAAAMRGRCSEVGFACVGAALDFIAGSSVRAPVWVQRLGLEWFWRLASDPRRLLPRYAECAYMLALIALGRDPMHRSSQTVGASQASVGGSL
jgi:N-acetylglucosaminyldiphosphoundecaprenol N-acetyl-beta-D-mannosaminyltransferase